MMTTPVQPCPHSTAPSPTPRLDFKSPTPARTLWLCGVLHAFTHLYNVALLPLYLLIQVDLKLASVDQATLLVTVMMLAYFGPSYPMGLLADRFSRKRILGIGLALNALGFVGLSFCGSYTMALASVVFAGLGGSFYHPAATAMVARAFPTNTGKALGLVAVGASVGFFFGPLYTGWRAASTGSWRTPVLELGLLGLVAAGLFMLYAPEESTERARGGSGQALEKMFPTRTLWLFFIGASLSFSLRDFTGWSMGSLGSLFMQKARGFDLNTTGLALSSIFLASIVSNPLFGGLSDRGRNRWLAFVLIVSAFMVAIFPRVPNAAVIPTLALYGFFFLAGYPIIEAALMESVHDSVRGRVFGAFITIGGMVGNLAHWAVGAWVKKLGAEAATPGAYYPLYALLAALVVLSLAGLPCLHAIRKREINLAPK